MIRLARARNVRRWSRAVLATGAAAAMVIVVGVAGTPAASASQAPVGLGTATSFAVLAGSTVTNTGPSVITGDVGVSAGSAVTGFPPGTVVSGTIHAADAVAAQAQADLTVAYNDAAGRGPATVVPTNLGGQPLVPGVYTSAAGTLSLTGNLTLNAQGDPNAVFIFQAASTLVTASASTVTLINGAQACHVFWQVGSSATLGTASSFVGNILALTSITATTGATVNGRLLARNGAVTLDTNTITRANCTAVPATPPTISTAFGAATIPLNGTTSKSFTITNPNPNTSLSGIGFTDTLPAGLVVATPNGLSGSSGGGSITATAGSGTISLSGATLGGGESITFSVNVTGTTSGTKVNTTSAVTSADSGAGSTATARFTVTDGGTLPITGRRSSTYASIALTLIGFGTALLTISRRLVRRRRHTT
jgi:hypothetical protein